MRDKEKAAGCYTKIYIFFFAFSFLKRYLQIGQMDGTVSKPISSRLRVLIRRRDEFATAAGATRRKRLIIRLLVDTPYTPVPNISSKTR